MPKNNNNLGDQYEVDVYNHCKKKGVIAPNTSRGGGGKGSDLTLIDSKGTHIKIEAKAKGADYGQKYVRYDFKLGKWVWAPADNTTKLYDIANTLNHINKKFVPLLQTKKREDYTVTDKESDSSNFRKNFPANPTLLPIFFDYYNARGTYYIQIKDYGLYHLGQDLHHLGTPMFDGQIFLRFRLKAIHAHSYWKDGKKLDSLKIFNDEKIKNPSADYKVEDTPWNSNFCALLKRDETKIRNTLTKSKLSIDGKDLTQKFPIL
jgi:hypothetical protein